ncbi:MAG: hypothetical protein IIB22_02925 [Chloroflexi bacterium]|nr:hypothetical protein [Chloroflexota bacterium]
MHTTRGESLHAGVFARPRNFSLIGLLLLMVGVLTATPATANASSGWELILDRPPPSFKGMDFVSAGEGWLVAGAGLLHTTDGGLTWQEQAKLSGADVDFADADHGWLVGLSGAIFATTDGGLTWHEQSSSTDVHLGDVAAVSATEAWAVGRGTGFSDVVDPDPPTAFLHTTDGGQTWVDVDPFPDAWFKEIVALGDAVWALGRYCSLDPQHGFCPFGPINVLARTTDRGETWSLEMDVPDRPEDMEFVDERRGWMIGTVENNGPVSHVFGTTDGGITWNQLASAFDHLLGVAFQDEMLGWRLSSIGPRPASGATVDISTDGGRDWRQISVVGFPSTAYSANLSFQGGKLFITGDNVALRSTDDGATWQDMSHPLVFNSMRFYTRTDGYAISGGQVLRTADAGQTWATLGPAPSHSTQVLFLDQQVGFAAGGLCCEPAQRFEIYRTEDGAKTWQLVHRIKSLSNSSVRDVEFVDENHGWFALEGGFLFTSDGGRSWREEPLPEDWSHLVAVDLAGPDVAWAVFRPTGIGVPNRLGHSKDGGRTWETTNIEGLERVEFVDSDHGWYQTRIWDDGASHTNIYATTDGATWELINTRPLLAYVAEFTFVDAVNGWLNESRCDGAGCTYEVLHTADGGRTWSGQLSGERLLGELQFVDERTGWFWLDPNRGIGIGDGSPNRTQLYHTTNGGGGPIGVPSTPTIQLPKVGAALPASGANLLSLVLVVGGFGLSLSAAGFAVARYARRP